MNRKIHVIFITLLFLSSILLITANACSLLIETKETLAESETTQAPEITVIKTTLSKTTTETT